MTHPYMDSTAKQALDALVSRLEGAIATSAGQTLAAPLEELRGRIDGLGERENVVLERLDALLAATQQPATPDDTAQRLEGLASALDGLGRRVDEQVERSGAGRAELESLAARLEALQQTSKQMLEGQEAQREAIAAALTGTWRTGMRDDLAATVEQAAAEVKRTLVPAAMALDERLVSLTDSCHQVVDGLATLTKSQQGAEARLASLEGALSDRPVSDGNAAGAWREELHAAVAPVVATGERQEALLAAVKSSVEGVQGRLETLGQSDHAAGEQWAALTRSVDGLGGRLSFAQEAMTTQAAFVTRVARHSRWAILLALLNLAASTIILGAFLGRHLVW